MFYRRHMEHSSIAKLDQATRMLAEVRSIDDAKDLINLAEAARVYAKQVKLGLEAQNHAAEIKLHAQRKAGEILSSMEKNKGAVLDGKDMFGGYSLKPPIEQPPTYAELGIDKRDAHTWQTFATNTSPEEFQEIIDEKKDKGQELSTAELYRELKKKKHQEEYKQSRRDMAESAKDIEPDSRWNIYHASIETWTAPRQYDFIITDPPYPKQYLNLYETLAMRAMTWLKPGGMLVAMCGQSYLNEIFTMMTKHMTYYWTACYLTLHQPTPLRQRNVNTTWKPLLMFVNDDYKGKIFGDVYKSDQNEKAMHDWQQSESGMLAIMQQLCFPGQYILDPFVGSGTTGIAAIQHGCLFDGIDSDIESVNIAKGRIHDAAKA